MYANQYPLKRFSFLPLLPVPRYIPCQSIIHYRTGFYKTFHFCFTSNYLMTIQLPSRFEPILSITFFFCKEINARSMVFLSRLSLQPIRQKYIPNLLSAEKPLSFRFYLNRHLNRHSNRHFLFAQFYQNNIFLFQKSAFLIVLPAPVSPSRKTLSQNPTGEKNVLCQENLQSHLNRDKQSYRYPLTLKYSLISSIIYFVL